MRALVRIFLILTGLHTAPVYAADSLQPPAAFSLAAIQLDDSSLYCEMPVVNQMEPAVESRVHPIWHVDAGYIDLGYIEDSYAPVDYQTLLESDDAVPPAVAQDFGMRLQNGWLLGVTYETIDTSLRIGTDVVEESVGPVYEGPMFVATWKFR